MWHKIVFVNIFSVNISEYCTRVSILLHRKFHYMVNLFAFIFLSKTVPLAHVQLYIADTCSGWNIILNVIHNVYKLQKSSCSIFSIISRATLRTTLRTYNISVGYNLMSQFMGYYPGNPLILTSRGHCRGVNQ